MINKKTKKDLTHKNQYKISLKILDDKQKWIIQIQSN